MYLKTDLHRLTDESVAASYKNTLFASLPDKAEKVHAVVEEVPPPPAPFCPNEPMDKLQECVNRVGQKNGRPPRRGASPGRATLALPDATWGG